MLIGSSSSSYFQLLIPGTKIQKFDHGEIEKKHFS